MCDILSGVSIFFESCEIDILRSGVFWLRLREFLRLDLANFRLKIFILTTVCIVDERVLMMTRCVGVGFFSDMTSKRLSCFMINYSMDSLCYDIVNFCCQRWQEDMKPFVSG